MTNFPLDAPYVVANAELGRDIIAELGVIEPHIDETDEFVTLPMRLVFHQAAGIHIEIGPYSLSELDIEQLREAIRQYDITRCGGTGIRRVK